MSLTKCVKVTGILRSLQHQGKLAVLVIPERCKVDWNWQYSKMEGIPRNVMTALTKEYDFTWKGFKAYMESSRLMAVKEDHKFIVERHRVLGPDLAAAHFLVMRGARVKFMGRNTWFRKDKEGNTYLPNTFIPDMCLEAIECTKMQMSYLAFDNMINLQQLRYLKLSRCMNLDDWCLARLHLFQHSLEFLDLTDCPEVTENGLTCLHVLKKLKGLKLSGLPNVQNMGLMVLLLEEALPECTIFGVEPERLEAPPTENDGQLSSDRLRSITSGTHIGGEETEEPTLIVEDRRGGKS